MIYTVTFNPAIDYVISLDKLSTGELNSYHFEQYGAGGKGINVSRMLTSLNVENIAFGFVGGFSGAEITNFLIKEGCNTDFIYLPQGHSRINVKICEKNKTETDLNGAGPLLPENAVKQILEKLKILEDKDTLVLAGSLPDGIDDTAYAQILNGLKDRDIYFIIDAAGDALLNTLKYRPFLVKPNVQELGELFEVRITTPKDIKTYAEKLWKMGAKNVLVSMGENGAFLILENGEKKFFEAIKGNSISAVGAGDSMIAGILYSLKSNHSLSAAIHWGLCAGAATAFTKGLSTANEIIQLYNATYKASAQNAAFAPST